MLMGALIVIFAVAAWYLREKPATAPGAAGAAISAPERK
jgi:hypothetical protein